MRPLAVGAAYLALAVAATWPLAPRAQDSVFGLGTPPLNVWAIGWVLHQLPRDPIHLFDGNVFYPYPRSLAFSEHLLAPSLLAAPWALATGNLVLAHNAVAILTLALAGLGMYLLCRELIGDPLAAFGGGLLYAFHTWNINELIRLQILSNAWFPFLLLALLRFFRGGELNSPPLVEAGGLSGPPAPPAHGPNWRAAAAVGAAYAAQSLSCMYWALYLPLVVAPTLLVLSRRHRVPARRLVPLAVALGLALSLTAVFFVPYLQNSQAFGLQRSEPASLPLDRYLDVLPGNLLYADALGTARVNENAAHFLGFSAILLAALALWPGGTALRGWRGLLLAFVTGGLLLSLGPRIQIAGHDLAPGPYALLYHFVPGFRSVRYPERFALVLVLGLAPLVAAGLARLRTRFGSAVAGAACGLLFVEHLAVPLALEPLPPPARAPSAYRWLAGQPEVRVVAEVPSSRNWMERADGLPMYFSTLHWKKTPQGFTGYFPPASNFIRWRLFHFPDPESVAFLRAFGVDTLVVRAEGGRLPDWARPSEDWSVVGPFAEGDAALRLRGADRLAFVPPSEEAPSGLVEVARGQWHAFASHPNPARAGDGRGETSWTTGEATKAGDHYGVRFTEPMALARISLDVREPFEFPTRLELEGRAVGGQEITIAYDAAAAYDRLFAFLLHRPREARLDLDVETPPLKELRLRISGNDHFQLPWTMAELRLYRRR